MQHALRGICYPIVASACLNFGACLVCPSSMSCDSGRLDVMGVIRGGGRADHFRPRSVVRSLLFLTQPHSRYV
ncbi:hypothetical protein BDP81DRAFT_434763 [Colletotrichum phormii]|uniref:Uncharacterized protein n=1 Tax=Colletotrichum phormii TaxID=359342 RepID=A0AAJ0EDV6_9PEZI|nr:uncharacterized protein BDP81DRAFT_434763 [Colletotrichum phormii]KAK1633370.1 hypothetical protein BDP81DRAFT_434763 [Colletotrichum phormii]